jgi:low temperature requirement protein LtrA
VTLGGTGESMTSGRTAVRLRRPEAPQRATFLELFFDLAFVFALFQLSHELLQHLRWTGALQVLIVFLAVWRIWGITTWITDRFDPQWQPLQLMVIVSLLGILILAAALPHAFGKYGLIFASIYVAMQIGRYLALVLAMRGHKLQPVVMRAVLWAGVTAVPWIAGAFVHGAAREGLWALAVAIDYAVFALNFPIPGAARVTPTWEPPVAAEHYAERYQQVFIIALGELILVSGLALTAGGFAPTRTVAFVVSIATAALLWRIYIYRAGELLSAALAASPLSARLGRFTVYAHLTMVFSIVVTAVGNQLVISHPSGRTQLAWAVVVLGGPALFLVARAGFEYTVFARVSWYRTVGVLLLAALTRLTLPASPLLAAVAATAVLTAVKTEGIDDLLDHYPTVKFLADSGYRGLANDHPDQVIAPPLKPKKDASPDQIAAYETIRKAQSSQRIPAEHAIALIKWWRPLQRYTGRREVLPDIIHAVTGLAADRAAEW